MRTPLDVIGPLPPAERLVALQGAAEDQWFDRKSARIHPQQLAETLVAFANAEGGCAVIGLENRQPADATVDPQAVNGWRQAGVDFAQPPVRSTVREMEWQDPDGQRGAFVAIEVPPSPQVHATRRDVVLLRVGDENRRLSFVQRQELVYDKGQAQYDGTTPQRWTLDDLDDDAIDAYADRLGAGDRERLLAARRIVTPEGEVTVAGMLLFGEEPEMWFPNAYLRIVRYRGTARGTGARLQVLEDHRIEGRIPDQIRRANDLMGELVPTRQALKSDGLFGSVPLIPHDAWLEGIVNAAVHRSYSNFGDHTRVEIFDDRIEIESPGRFPGVVEVVDPLTVTRFARNPHIARIAAELGLGREFGEGIRRMFDEMRHAHLNDPVYHQTSGSTRLVLPADPVESDPGGALTGEARQIARLLRDAGRLSTGDLVDAMGRSRPWVLEHLRDLEDAGLVEWVGEGSRDPRAFWRLRVD